MSAKETAKRYTLFVFCLFFIGLGIAFTKHAGLGVSTVSAVADVISIKIPSISFGTWLFISNMFFLLGQIVILRKDFQPIQLLQIPLSLLFGYFTDFGLWLISTLPNDKYWIQLILVIIGVFVLGFGITLGVIANVIQNSAEAFVKAISDVSKKDFSNVKIAFDIIWVIIAIVLSLILFNGEIKSVREGTIISAVFVGIVVKILRPVLSKPLNKFITK